MWRISYLTYHTSHTSPTYVYRTFLTYRTTYRIQTAPRRQVHHSFVTRPFLRCKPGPIIEALGHERCNVWERGTPNEKVFVSVQRLMTPSGPSGFVPRSPRQTAP